MLMLDLVNMMSRSPAGFPAVTTSMVIALGVWLCLGCSAKKGDPTQKTVPEQYIQAQVAAVQKAKSFKAVYDNPKMGECPVCGKPINYESFVSIGHKKYALCSDDCAQKLQDDPNRYLADSQP